MPGLAFAISVHSPCTGEQLVNKVDPNIYTGAGGDFSYVVLVKSPSGGPWLITIYDFSGSPCTPSKTYVQIVSDDDPEGGYGLDTPNGPDPAQGEATVTSFP